jgi:hypothetical protein
MFFDASALPLPIGSPRPEASPFRRPRADFCPNPAIGPVVYCVTQPAKHPSGRSRAQTSLDFFSVNGKDPVMLGAFITFAAMVSSSTSGEGTPSGRLNTTAGSCALQS